jgi:tetratricopeptide (TPR) repeat protein
MLALVNWPFPVRDQRPVDHYNASIQLVAGQKIDEAMRAVEAGLAIDPRFGPLHFARGNLLYNLEQYAEAEASFRAAIQYNPLNPIAHFNLALALARQDDACGARDTLRRAAQTGVAFDLKMDRLLRELNEACTTSATSPASP